MNAQPLFTSLAYTATAVADIRRLLDEWASKHDLTEDGVQAYLHMKMLCDEVELASNAALGEFGILNPESSKWARK